MSNETSDELFARSALQTGIARAEHVVAARKLQADDARNGVRTSLADALILLNFITPDQRDRIQKRPQIPQQGKLQRLGKYEILKKLGEGAMGAVYLAEDTLMGRKVALKILPIKHAGDSEFISRFKREAKAAGKLNHVNIVSAYEAGEDMGYHYYAMEYCDGEPLDARLKREMMLDCNSALEIVIQVARGLSHAHQQGFVHRDIKPANIFLTSDGVAKILDLGLSKDIVETDKSFNTMSGVAVGTPHYISPEQARGDKIIDGRTDIYSLGATFYHLVTGQTPFQGMTAALIMVKHINDQLPNPQDIREDIPVSLVQVIQKMMAKAASDRYRDCEALISDLELVINGHDPVNAAVDAGKSSVAMRLRATGPRFSRRTTGPHPPVPQRSGRAGAKSIKHEKLERTKKSSAVWPGAVLAAVLAAILGLAFLFMSGKTPSETAVKPNDKPKGTLEDSVARTQPAVNSPTPVVASAPVQSFEARAAQDFEIARGDTGDKSSRIARLQNFLQQYGESGVAARARAMLAELNAPPATKDTRDKGANEVVWIDDAIPVGATEGREENCRPWQWVKSPVFNGTLSHMHFSEPDQTTQHFYVDPSSKFDVKSSDVLFTYVFIDPGNQPKEIMLQWKYGDTWGHRAYWGDDLVRFPGDENRLKVGSLPKPGMWVRLQVQASAIGVTGKEEKIDGVAFTQWGGKVYWDKTGVARTVDTALSASAVDDPERWKNAIELLPLIDPQKDAIESPWHLKNGELVSEPAANSRLEIPYFPPDEYDFRIIFTRPSGTEMAGQMLTLHGHPFSWIIGAWSNTLSGFDSVGGLILEPNGKNPTVTSFGFDSGRKHDSILQVRTTGVKAFVDGKLISEMKTDGHDLSRQNRFNLHDNALLGLQTWTSEIVFHHIQVLEITNRGKFTRQR